MDVAPGGPEALKQLEQQDYDAVLLDSMMPGMNGIEVLTTLRASHSSTDLPVIMVTAVAESAKVAEALSLGANDYVTKPVDLQVAEARIRSQVSRKYAERALRQSEERYALAARGANDGLWDWDLKTNRIYYSPRWKALLGYSEAEIGDDPGEWLSRIHIEDEESKKSAG